MQVEKRYRGRISQIPVCLGKMLRMFFYQNDWKVLPLSAAVAGLVGIVIRHRIFINMEGTLMSGLAVTSVCLWNGCFNSIQAICREREIVKREHRGGMHITSYIMSHMIYQALICAMQTAIILFVFRYIGVRFPEHSIFERNFLIEYFISLFLITYAADMMSLFISTLCRSTTTAMTVMPVVLILQLVFSGGMITLPKILDPLSDYFISNTGFKLIAAEADYNDLELTTAWSAVEQIKNNEISGTVSVGQLADIINNSKSATMQSVKSVQILGNAGETAGLTIGDLVAELSEDNPDAANLRKKEIPYKTSVGDLLEIAGESNVRSYVVKSTSRSAQRAAYDYNAGNVIGYWLKLAAYSLFFAVLAVIFLEFIDKDKR
ncbi:MAG: ABC transporter permease [Lachnospiraceae bacterium]|nr:ABC transporter permease [Lachnospiraceae bacterium]